MRIQRFSPILIVFAAACGESNSTDPDAGVSADSGVVQDAGFADSGVEADAGVRSFAGLVVNEVAAAGSPDDWFELYNGSSEAIDLEGVHFSDDPDRPLRATFGAGTVIEAGGYLVQVVSEAEVGFGLGSDELVVIFDPDGVELDRADWPEEGSPETRSWGRIPDGTGDFTTLDTPTPGAANVANEPSECGDDLVEAREVCDGADLASQSCESLGYASGTLACNADCEGYDVSGCVVGTLQVFINEVTSTGDDQIELINLEATDVDLEGWSVTDDGWDPADPTTDDHRYTLPTGTTIGAGGYLVLVKNFDHLFGLGGSDSVTLYDAADAVADTVTWATDAADPSYCRSPDGTGAFMTCAEQTFGAANP